LLVMPDQRRVDRRLALGIGVNNARLNRLQGVVVRPLDGRDPDTMANVTLRLQ